MILPRFQVHQIFDNLGVKGKEEMARRKGVKNRRYEPEFKAQALALAKEIGGNEAAMRLGIPESSLWNWINAHTGGKAKQGEPTLGGKLAARATPSGPGVQARPERSVLSQALAVEKAKNDDLVRQLADLQADVAILKKAAAYFARQSK